MPLIKYVFLLTCITILSACGGSGGGGGNNNSGGGTNPPDSLASPAILYAVAGDGFVKLTWPSVSGASSYNLYWATSSGTTTQNGTLITGVSSPYEHSGLFNDTTYYYILTAVNSVTESAPTVEFFATPVTASPGDVLISSIAFNDSNLATCVNAQSKVYVGDLLYLDCSGKSISDLTGLDALTNLRTLYLNDNPITNHNVLFGMASLTQLYLNNTGFSNTTGIGTLTGLTWLNLEFNGIVDVTPLASLTNLTQLFLNSNNIGNSSDGHVDSLVTLVNANWINLTGNISMSCGQLQTLMNALPGTPSLPVVDLDNNVLTRDSATDGFNCTNP